MEGEELVERVILCIDRRVWDDGLNFRSGTRGDDGFWRFSGIEIATTARLGREKGGVAPGATPVAAWKAPEQAGNHQDLAVKRNVVIIIIVTLVTVVTSY